MLENKERESKSGRTSRMTMGTEQPSFYRAKGKDIELCTELKERANKPENRKSNGIKRNFPATTWHAKGDKTNTRRVGKQELVLKTFPPNGQKEKKKKKERTAEKEGTNLKHRGKFKEKNDLEYSGRNEPGKRFVSALVLP